MEIDYPLDVFQVERFCIEPGCNGYMLYYDKVITMLPPTYQHECNRCGIVKNYGCVYPYIKQVKRKQ